MHTLNPVDLAFAREFRARVQAAVGDYATEFRVFGSRATGRARPDSDLDLFILVENDDPVRKGLIQDLAYDLSREQELPYYPSAHVVSRDRWERSMGLETLFSRDILEQGIRV